MSSGHSGGHGADGVVDQRADAVSIAYDRWAATYDDDANATRDLDAVVVRRAPLRIASAEVVELGCGTGKNTAWLSREAGRVHAFDFSEGMLARARARVETANVSFVVHDIRVPWPLPDRSVDVVVGTLVLEHINDLAPIYAQARRVLREHGQLFLCELHPFRQLRGGQAHFTDAATGELVHVAAFVHSTSEYVTAALADGFTLRSLSEWMDAGATDGAVPRLLSMLFESS